MFPSRFVHLASARARFGDRVDRLGEHLSRVDPIADAVVASVDALPAQLAYVRNGQVPVLLGQQCYQWGYQCVSLLVDKILLKKDPSAVRQVSALIPVTIDNVDAYAKNWDTWLHK